jgi:DNA-binding transcriptional regulator YhcF (GntR family)
MINGHTIEDIRLSAPPEAENLSWGYVKLYRSITKKAWYKKSEYVHLFCHLLLKASHSGFETWFNGISKILQPGQLVTGRKKLSEETGINEHKIDRILKTFESEQQIEQQKTNTSRLITILNWIVYQKSEQQIKQPLSNGCATTEQQLSTIQEGLKKENNVLESESVAPSPTFSKEQLEYFNLYQVWIKKNTPVVAQMKEQITIKQFSSFFKKFPAPTGQKLFEAVLVSMNNWEGLLKKRSTYTTIIWWIKNEKYDEEIIKIRDRLKLLTLPTQPKKSFQEMQGERILAETYLQTK